MSNVNPVISLNAGTVQVKDCDIWLLNKMLPVKGVPNCTSVHPVNV